ncbi:MAG: ArsR/SmtB family transcription factor [Planctomycetota bacterium]|jgi:ArsR family transcriptional regulator
MQKDFYELHANICGIFSSPRRLEILDTLRDKELTVSEILDSMSISKTNLSQHLSLMKDRGILNSRRDGQHIYYSVSSKKVIQAYDLISDVLRELMDRRLSKLQ